MGKGTKDSKSLLNHFFPVEKDKEYKMPCRILGNKFFQKKNTDDIQVVAQSLLTFIELNDIWYY
jgi:hypothetical protein